MKRSVALLIETSNEYARGMLRGILPYQQEHEQWTIHLSEQHRGADPPWATKRIQEPNPASGSWHLFLLVGRIQSG